MELFEDEMSGGNTPELTVSELAGDIKRTVEGAFGHVRVRGELGRVSRPKSGHVYLDLKDDRAVISGVIWKGVASRLDTPPEEGMEVVATGRLTTFPGQSRYQIVIEDLRPAGMGALMAMLDKRRKMLAAEGLFDADRKKPLPRLPEVIGVVTSPSGAVIRDILHRLRDRFPRKVLIWPVSVQGKGSAQQVADGISGFNAFTPGGALPRPDVLIVARGGGSVEDLWGFNEEIVVRAAAASDIPLISAVGHETDTTLIDFASDLRAPTPTAAAEHAVPVRSELLAWLADRSARMSRAQVERLTHRGQRLRDVSRALPKPERLLDPGRQRLDLAAERLPRGLLQATEQRRLAQTRLSAALRPVVLSQRLAQLSQRLDSAGSRLVPALVRSNDQKRRALGQTVARLGATSLHQQRSAATDRLADLTRRLIDANRLRINTLREQMTALDRVRETLGYRATLARGYAVVRGEGDVVTTRADAESKGITEIEFVDGRLRLSGARRSRSSGAPNTEQGSLF